MKPGALPDMEPLREIAFTDALVRLQDMLEAKVKIELNQLSRFFGIGIEAHLVRVETLPPDHVAIRFVLDNHTQFYLDPDQVKTSLGGGFDIGPTWIEFELPEGPTLLIERNVEEESSDASEVD
jgi:hypothetical protein